MAFDYNTMFFNTTSAVTETVTSDAMDFHGPDLAELTYRLVINGTVSGTSPQIVWTLETSDNGSDYSTEKTLATVTTAGETLVKYRCQKRYRKMKLTVSGTSPSFGHVEAGIDSGSRGKIR